MKIIKYDFFENDKLNEEGVAMATAGNTSGMGSVTAPGIGNINSAGLTGALNVYNGDGHPTPTGTNGSGDLPTYDMSNKFDTNPFKKKKKKTTKENRHFGTETTKEDMYVTSWSDWNSDFTNETINIKSIKDDMQDIKDFIIENNETSSHKYQSIVTKCNIILQFIIDNKINETIYSSNWNEDFNEVDCKTFNLKPDDEFEMYTTKFKIEKAFYRGNKDDLFYFSYEPDGIVYNMTKNEMKEKFIEKQ